MRRTRKPDSAKVGTVLRSTDFRKLMSRELTFRLQDKTGKVDVDLDKIVPSDVREFYPEMRYDLNRVGFMFAKAYVRWKKRKKYMQTIESVMLGILHQELYHSEDDSPVSTQYAKEKVRDALPKSVREKALIGFESRQSKPKNLDMANAKKDTHPTVMIIRDQIATAEENMDLYKEIIDGLKRYMDSISENRSDDQRERQFGAWTSSEPGSEPSTDADAAGSLEEYSRPRTTRRLRLKKKKRLNEDGEQQG